MPSPKRPTTHTHQTKTLEYGDLRTAVKLPEGEDKNEWLALNVSNFYNQVQMLYMTITEFCTEETCPVMRAGPSFTYRWSDSNTYPTPVEVSAPKYIRLLFDWVLAQIDNEQIFPSVPDDPFPPDFLDIIQNIMKRLFRVYAHCYHHHIETFHALGTIVHLNTSFQHFIFFAKEFDLIPDDQLDPLSDLISTFL